jgi:Leucine-rich repeat (LRR) protein
MVGVLKLKGFRNLEVFKCSNNKLTNLDLSDCKKLKKLTCDNNEIYNLNFLNSVDNLQYLNINNCPLGGSLKPLANLKKLEKLHISNTDFNEGLEYLLDCKKIYCNSSYQYKSIKIVKELEKYGKC